MANQGVPHDHWTNLFLQERVRAKFEAILRLATKETIPGVGDVLVYVGSLADLSRAVTHGKWGLYNSISRSGLLIPILRANPYICSLWTIFESVSEAIVFKNNDGPDTVCQWFEAHRPWILRRSSTAGKHPTHLFATGETLPGPALLGCHSSMVHLADMVYRVAPTDMHVLIWGETGVGKALVAEWIHLKSLRNREAFVMVNCAAIPDALLESEFFGHTKGAFTGAIETHPGLLDGAHQGTLFLDEVGDLSLSGQAKLLSVLETHRYKPVGGRKERESSFRLIAATNKDLKAEIAKGAFREDLFHRLNVFPMYVPPLRERLDDLPHLVTFFVSTLSARLLRAAPRIGGGVLPALRSYAWPGNIRELRNVIERALILCDGTLKTEHLSVNTEGKEARRERKAGGDAVFLLPDPFGEAGFDGVMAAIERCMVEEALARYPESVTLAAKALGLNRTTLVEKRKRLMGDEVSDHVAHDNNNRLV